jgi:hypothetical protein
MIGALAETRLPSATELAKRFLCPTDAEGTALLSNSYAFAAIFKDDQAR